MKWALFTNRKDYIGHDTKPYRTEVTNHTADAKREVKVPATVTELRSYLGLCTVFRGFVANSAGISSPLAEQLEKNYGK